MGMFDHVNFEMNCPTCGGKMRGFQTKSGPCISEMLDPTEVDNFYSYCCDRRVTLDTKVRESKEPRAKVYTLSEVLELGFTLRVKN